MSTKKELGILEKNNSKGVEQLPKVYDKLVVLEKNLDKQKKLYTNFSKHLNYVRDIKFEMNYQLDDIMKLISIDSHNLLDEKS